MIKYKKLTKEELFEILILNNEEFTKRICYLQGECIALTKISNYSDCLTESEKQQKPCYHRLDIFQHQNILLKIALWKNNHNANAMYLLLKHHHSTLLKIYPGYKTSELTEEGKKLEMVFVNEIKDPRKVSNEMWLVLNKIFALDSNLHKNPQNNTKPSLNNLEIKIKTEDSFDAGTDGSNTPDSKEEDNLNFLGLPFEDN
jgi:hypothetical protein